MQRRGREVIEGQRYQKTGAGGGPWEVVALRSDIAGALHARLQSLQEPSTFRTFAAEVLLDPRNFRLMDET